MECVKEFRKNGIDHALEKETEKGIIYRLHFNGAGAGFIAIKKKAYTHQPKNFIIDLNLYRLPSNEDFGRWAWQCQTLEDAERKLAV